MDTSETTKNISKPNKIKLIAIIILSIVLIALVIFAIKDHNKSITYDKFKDYRPEGYEKIVKENVGPMNGADVIYYVFDNYIAERSNEFFSSDNDLKEEGKITFYYYDNNLDEFNKWKSEGYNDIKSIISKSDHSEIYASYQVKN